MIFFCLFLKSKRVVLGKVLLLKAFFGNLKIIAIWIETIATWI